MRKVIWIGSDKRHKIVIEEKVKKNYKIENNSDIRDKKKDKEHLEVS